MRAAIHPDNAMLFVSADRFVNGYKLMRHRVPLLPDPHGKRAAVNVSDNMNLALMLQQRKAAGSKRQAPLSRLIIDRKALEFDKRRARATLRFVFGIRTWRSPDAG